MNKKILASLILIGLLGAAAGIGTWAYYSSTRTMNPGFYTASLDLELNERYGWETVLDNIAPGEDRVQIFDLSSTGTDGSYSELEISYEAPCLCVSDGATEWAEISIPVDIAIEDITGLTFWEKIDLFSASGWDVNVILGVDCDGDGYFNADLPKWHGIPGPMHLLADLHGDSFVEMDGWGGLTGGTFALPVTYAGLSADVDWTKVDACNVSYGWWTVKADGTGFAHFGTITGGSFGDYLTWLDGLDDDGLIDKGDRVKCIKLVLGGSGLWKDECAFVRNIKLNGVLQPLPDIGEVITVKVEEWKYAWATPQWATVHEGSTLKQWAGYTMKILDDSDGVGSVRITLHFKESAGNEYQNICGNIEFTFTLWQGP